MAKSTQKSSSDTVLNSGVGGLSGLIAETQPSPLLAPGASPTPFSLSARTAVLNISTPHGNSPSSNGKKPAPTEPKGSTTPRSTLVGTLNWAVRMLVHRGLVKVEEVRDEDGALEGYVIRLAADNWVLTPDNLLALKDEAK